MPQEKIIPPQPVEPPPIDPVGPGGPQPGYNLNWAYQQSRYATEVAAGQQSNPSNPEPATAAFMAGLYK
jgi:hypothetical protein